MHQCMWRKKMLRARPIGHLCTGLWHVDSRGGPPGPAPHWFLWTVSSRPRNQAWSAWYAYYYSIIRWYFEVYQRMMSETISITLPIENHEFSTKKFGHFLICMNLRTMKILKFSCMMHLEPFLFLACMQGKHLGLLEFIYFYVWFRVGGQGWKWFLL